jgi:hypothetical protein
MDARSFWVLVWTKMLQKVPDEQLKQLKGSFQKGEVIRFEVEDGTPDYGGYNDELHTDVKFRIAQKAHPD